MERCLASIGQWRDRSFQAACQLGIPDLNAHDEYGRTVIEIIGDRGMQEELQILLKGNSGGVEVRNALSRLRHMVEG